MYPRNLKLFAFSFLIFIGSCTSFEDYQANPNAVEEVHPRLLLPALESQIAFHQGTNASRMAGMMTQYFSGYDVCGPADLYYITSAEMDNFWKSMYADVLSNCIAMEEEATKENLTFYIALAHLFKANALGKLTTVFGDIPVNEALQGATYLQPKYDTQSEVYLIIMDQLDQAIALLNKPDNSYTGGDLFYDGDWQLWLKCANAFKARYLLQQDQVAPTNYTEILDLINQSFLGYEEEPSFQFGKTASSDWSLSKFARERPATLLFGDYYLDVMYHQNDPRIDKLMVEKSWGAFDFYELNNEDLYWGKPDALVPIISFCELKFMEAECLAKLEQNPSAAFQMGIRTNMEILGVEEMEITNYLSTKIISGLTQDEQLELILAEAYKSYFGYNFDQAYNNFRRTGYPNLSPLPDRSNVLNPSGVIPKRMTYVESEERYNRANLEAAKARQNGALLDEKLWIFPE